MSPGAGYDRCARRAPAPREKAVNLRAHAERAVYRSRSSMKMQDMRAGARRVLCGALRQSQTPSQALLHQCMPASRARRRCHSRRRAAPLSHIPYRDPDRWTAACTRPLQGRAACLTPSGPGALRSMLVYRRSLDSALSTPAPPSAASRPLFYSVRRIVSCRPQYTLQAVI